MRKFKSSFTPHRTIIVIGLVGGFICLIAAIYSTDSLLSSLQVNLATNFFTISFTTGIIDWLGNKDRERQNKPARELAISALISIIFSLRMHLALLYGLRPENIRGKLSESGEFEDLRLGVANYINNLNLETGEIKADSKWLNFYTSELNEAKVKLTEVMSLYSSVLPADTRNAILLLISQIKEVLTYFQLFPSPQKINRGDPLCSMNSWLRKYINNLDVKLR